MNTRNQARQTWSSTTHASQNQCALRPRSTTSDDQSHVLGHEQHENTKLTQLPTHHHVQHDHSCRTEQSEPQSEQLKRNTSADRERGKRCTTFTREITVLTAERSGATAVKETFWHHNRCCQLQTMFTLRLMILGHSDGDNLGNFCASREHPRGMHIGVTNRPRALIGIPRTPIMHLPYSAKWIFNCPTIWLRHVGRAVPCGTH